jgi:hypothetical protein
MTDDELIAAMLNAYETERHYLEPNFRMRAVLDMVRLHDAKHRPAETEKPRRVPVQISGYGEGLTTGAVANDGTVWVYEFGVGWRRLPDLPQD